MTIQEKIDRAIAEIENKDLPAEDLVTQIQGAARELYVSACHSCGYRVVIENTGNIRRSASNTVEQNLGAFVLIVLDSGGAEIERISISDIFRLAREALKNSSEAQAASAAKEVELKD